MQAGDQKLGVIVASYASAIIGVFSPVSSHCYKKLAKVADQRLAEGGYRSSRGAVQASSAFTLCYKV